MDLTQPVTVREYKVQQVKAGHFLCTLPQAWTRARELHAGDTVIVETLSDGSLKVKKKEGPKAAEPSGPGPREPASVQKEGSLP